MITFYFNDFGFFWYVIDSVGTVHGWKIIVCMSLRFFGTLDTKGFHVIIVVLSYRLFSPFALMQKWSKRSRLNLIAPQDLPGSRTTISHYLLQLFTVSAILLR